jgi:hypothetical protein
MDMARKCNQCELRHSFFKWIFSFSIYLSFSATDAFTQTWKNPSERMKKFIGRKNFDLMPSLEWMGVPLHEIC